MKLAGSGLKLDEEWKHEEEQCRRPLSIHLYEHGRIGSSSSGAVLLRAESSVTFLNLCSMVNQVFGLIAAVAMDF